MHWKKEGGCILQPKVHYSQNIDTEDHLESGLILICFFNSMVFIALSNIKLGEDLLASQFLKLGPNVREWSVVSYYPFI